MTVKELKTMIDKLPTENGEILVSLCNEMFTFNNVEFKKMEDGNWMMKHELTVPRNGKR